MPTLKQTLRQMPDQDLLDRYFTIRLTHPSLEPAYRREVARRGLVRF